MTQSRKISYVLMDPSGNRTILVETPVDVTEQPRIAEALMKEEPSAEQTGFLSIPGDGEKASEPVNPREGYTLVWYLDEECELYPYDFNVAVDRNITLYAKWTQDEDPNSGNDNPDDPNDPNDPGTGNEDPNDPNDPGTDNEDPNNQNEPETGG